MSDTYVSCPDISDRSVHVLTDVSSGCLLLVRALLSPDTTFQLILSSFQLTFSTFQFTFSTFFNLMIDKPESHALRCAHLYIGPSIVNAFLGFSPSPRRTARL